jgi:hypothetical protein
MRCSIFLLVAVELVALAACGSARADEWLVERSVSARVAHNTNLSLLPGTNDPTDIFTLSPGARFASRTESRDLGADLRLNINRYGGKSQLNYVGYAVSGNGSWVNERNAWGLNLTSVRDTTLQTELATTGVVQAMRVRTLFGAAPYWSYALSETLQARLDYQFTAVRYEPGSGLVNNNTQTLNAGLQKSLSERTSAGATVSYGRFRTDPDVSETDFQTLSFNAIHDFTERLKLNANVGIQRTQTDIKQVVFVCPATGQVNDPLCALLGGLDPLFTFVPETVVSHFDDHTWVANIAASYASEKSTFEAVFARDLNPTGNGLLVRTERLQFAYKRSIDERLSFSLEAGALYSRYVTASGGQAWYQRTAGTVQWQADPYFSLSLGVSHLEQRNGAQAPKAYADEIFLNAVYSWPKISVAR